MGLMRNLPARLLTMLLYSSSVLFLPTLNLSARAPAGAKAPTASQTSCCAMCRSTGAGHHCSCCQHGTCTCELSSTSPDESVNSAFQPALTQMSGVFRIVLMSAPLLSPAPRFLYSPCLPVLKPPPKSRAF